MRSPSLISRSHAVLIQVSLGYPPLPGMYPRVTHPFATRHCLYCYSQCPVRLACLIHAASVRSEPESNSPNRKLIPLSKRLAAPCGAAIVLQRKIDMNKAFLKRLCSARYLSSRAAHNLAFCFLTASLGLRLALLLLFSERSVLIPRKLKPLLPLKLSSRQPLFFASG